LDKTNAARLLEARGVPYRATVYDAARAFHSADEAAALLGAPPDAVYKTLVVLREPPGPRARPLLVLVPSDRQLDLKQLARATGDKKLRMASQKEAEALTGLQVGGISALAVRAGAFEVLVDAGARERERVHVSAGVRGVDLEVAVADLVRVTGARFVPAAGPASAGPAPAGG
jgi:Cys-tRNA(Pro)/Cys-tRNA(Cys) deacylase